MVCTVSGSQASGPSANKMFPQQTVFMEEKHFNFLILYYSGTSRYLILFLIPFLPAKYSLFSSTCGLWEADGFSGVAALLVHLEADRQWFKVGVSPFPFRVHSQETRVRRKGHEGTLGFVQSQKSSSRVVKIQMCLHTLTSSVQPTFF